MAEYDPYSRQPEPRSSTAADRWAVRITEPGQTDRWAEWHDRPADATETPTAPPRGCLFRLNFPSSVQSSAPGPACTLYRGANGPRVRAWSETVLLNGQAIVDAEIQPGDRLVLGNLELELVELPSSLIPDNDQRTDSPLETAIDSEDVESNQSAAAASTCRAVDVIPPREHDDAEESVEEHLARLLKRVCGEDVARDFARQRERNQTAQPTAAHEGDDPPEFAPLIDTERTDESQAVLTIHSLSERRLGELGTAPGNERYGAGSLSAPRPTPATPPPVAPLRPRDVQADWSGLRELANQSARAAIETHQLKGVARSARSRLSAAVLFAVSGTIGLYAIPGDQWLPLLGVLAAYGATVLWLLRTLRGSRTIRGAGGT